MMDDATRRAWEATPYARVLRDAAAAVAAQTMTAAALWASVFGDASKWFDPDADPHERPTEYAALRRVFWTARNASCLWADWRNARDAALYAGELDALAHAAEIAAVQAARRAEYRAIRDSQLRLPLPDVA